ncbi:flagellar M-ring protein FliF, partial [bacterium DOLZORAL124_64_63]
MDGIQQFIDTVKRKLGELSFNQKIMLGAVGVATILSVTVFSLWIQKEDMGVLFANLSPEDAGATMDELRKMSVDFELQNGGTTILVPENLVNSLRIEMHSKGLVTDSVTGFEIFDGKSFGWTEFIQNVNYQRALEGELTRTIESLTSVQSARVHLVLPKPSIFNKAQAGATASVTLKLGRGVHLGENQIGGIQSLVASSVPNLNVDNVRIHDTTGRELSSSVQDTDVGRSQTQLELRKEVERHLTEKAQGMLDRALGPGRSIVQVSATLNFEKIESEREIFDPQGIVVRSEERNEINSPERGTEESSLTNNELNRTVEHVVSEVGNVTHLSVSVMVDGHYEPSEDGGEMVYVPLTDTEITN